MDLVDPIAQPAVALLRLLVAGLLGGVIGVERERSKSDAREHFAGVRTFPIFAALGAALALISGSIGLVVTAGFAGVAALVIVSYVASSRQGHVGATTETAALASYWIGVMAGAGALLLAGALGIGLTVLLAAKQRLEAFPRTLTPAELQAALTLAVIAAVVLPVLPNTAYGPWGVWNPRLLWGMVVVVCGLSFTAFVAVRLWGPSRGLYLSGLLGGLVSSTAATVSLAARSRETATHSVALAAAAGLASLVMFVRIGVLAAIAGPSVLAYLGPFLAAATIAGGVAVAFLARRADPAGEAVPPLTNPFSLREAIRFAVLYAVVLVAVEAAARYLGAWGVRAAALLAGLTDVDAITLGLAGLAGTVDLGTGAGALSAREAAAAIGIAALANTAAKVGYAVGLGDRRFGRTVLVILASSFVAGSVALAVVARS